jgi:anti-anti-sigma factor
MFEMQEKDREIRFRISSEMRMVDAVVRETDEFLARNGVNDTANTRTVLRELLINAVEHGNRKEENRSVHCRIEPDGHNDGDRYAIVVEDEGSGFDFRSISSTMPEDPEQLRSRGYPLIHSLSESVEFEKGGGRVRVVMRTLRREPFPCRREGDLYIVSPCGDITAANADALREALRRAIDEGATRFRFELDRVRDIDSIGLSTLIVLVRTLRARGIEPDLEAFGVQGDVRTLFAMTQLDRLYTINEGNAPHEKGTDQHDR